MFRFFESLVDPYVDHEATDRPPNRLWPFLWSYAQPFKKVFAVSAIMSVVTASIEVWLLWYLGRVIDLLSGGAPAEVWEANKTELFLVAGFILLVRPLVQGLDVALLNNVILPNFGTLIRWRAHGHVLRQSIGWFEDDFAGRIANRVTQTPPAAGEAVFQVFDAITFSLAYAVGAFVLLADADIRLTIPLLIWLGLYALLIRWTVRRVGPASKAASDARSAVTGNIVDAYTNIHSVKLFAQSEHELQGAKGVIENTRQTFAREMRIFSIMDFTLVILNGVLIVGVVGWAIYLWLGGSATAGVIAAATALVLRLNAMTGWIMWALTSFFRELGVVSEGMETIAQPITLVDGPDAQPLVVTEGRIEIAGLSHHYGRQSGGIDSLDLLIERGRKGWDRRAIRCGKVDPRKATFAVLRRRGRSDPNRRPGYSRRYTRQPARRDRDGSTGKQRCCIGRFARTSLYGNAQASEGADDRRPPGELRRWSSLQTCKTPKGRRGHDCPCGRARREAVGWSAPADRTCPRDPEGRADPGAGRGDERAGQRGGGGHSGHALWHDAQARR